MRRLLLTAALALAAAGTGATEAEGPFRVTVPSLPRAPVTDGTISPSEWDGASGGVVALTPGGRGLAEEPHGRFALGQRDGRLHVLFVADRLPAMPVAMNTDRDSAVWTDDAVELFVNIGGQTLQLVANARGGLADLRNGDLGANLPWRVAGSTIGADFAAAEGRRGFVVEAELELPAAGLTVPAAGTVLGLQVAFDRPGHNPWTVWAPYADSRLGERLPGEAIWGGSTTRIEAVRQDPLARTVTIAGATAAPLQAALCINDGPEAVGPLDGVFERAWPIPGGSRYRLSSRAPGFLWQVEGRVPAAVPLLAVPNPSQGAFYLETAPHVSPQDLDLRLERDGRVWWQLRLTAALLAARQRLRVPWAGQAPGPVELVATLAESGTEVARIPLRVPVPPAWASFALPAGLPEVPPPFVPVQADRSRCAVLGRTLGFGDGPFVCQVTSGGTELLAAPATLQGNVGRTAVAWQTRSWELQAADPRHAVYRGEAAAGGLALRTRVDVEFDGLTRLDFELVPPPEGVTLSDLCFVLPLRRERATAFARASLPGAEVTDWDGLQQSGDLTDAGWHSPFVAHVWLGDMAAGIEWLSEGPVGWRPRDPKTAIEVVCDGGAATLRAHLIDGEIRLEGPRRYTFAILPTPVRPYPARFGGDRSILMVRGFDERYTVRPAVVLYAARGDFTPNGCVEVCLRPDADPPDHDLELLRLQDGAQSVPALAVTWSAANQALQVRAHDGTVWLSAPAVLRRGQWHQVALNHGDDRLELWVDGTMVGAGTFTGTWPRWGHTFPLRTLGSAGLSLRGWRISRAPRTAAELGRPGSWVADAQTSHLERLMDDPTPLCLTNPEVGYLDAPGYLQGAWTYDAAEKCLRAGADSPARCEADHLKLAGFDVAIGFCWAKTALGLGGADNPEGQRRHLALARQHGLRTAYYLADGTCDALPEYPDYKWEFSYTGPESEPIANWRDRGSFFSGPPGPADYKSFLSGVQGLLDLGLSGVYLDGITYALCSACPTRRPSRNPLVDAEIALDPDSGAEVATAKVFEHRRMLWDMARLLVGREERPVVDAHNSNGYTLATMGMVTSATTGELLGLFPERWRERLELPVYRGEYYGRHRGGFLAEALFYFNDPVPPEFGMALTGIHGQTPRARWGMDPARASALWRLMDHFATADAEWLPYWDSRAVFTTGSDTVLTSAYVLRRRRTLLLVTNWSDEPCDGRIGVDWRALGLDPKASPVRLLNWNRPLAVEEGTIALPLRPRQLLYVWLGSGAL